jgi:hypothetical protein
MMQRGARLRRKTALERSLMHWTEGEPDFTPTYKYRPGTGKYDLRGTPWDPDSKVRLLLVALLPLPSL